MHILLIHQAFASIDEPGGTRHHEIARALADQGHKITIIASPISYLTGLENADLKKSRMVNGVTIFRVYTYPALHKSFFHRIISFFSFMVSSFVQGLKIKNVDLIWGTSPPIFQGFTAWVISRLKRVPFLFEVRDLWPAFAIAVGVLKNKILIRLSLWLETFLYSHADAIVVNSPGFVDHIRQKSAKEISIVPNGSDISMFEPMPSGKDFRVQHNLGGKFIVMYTGAHGISNDLTVVLDAAEQLLAQDAIQFVLLGDGKEKTNLIFFAQHKKLSNVIFLDPLPKNQMKYALAAADVCIAILKPIDLYKTTFPNKVFDYMAAKKPIILAIDGEIRKVVEDAKCGVFCEPGNPIELANATMNLYLNKKRLRIMGENGRSYLAEHFDRNNLALKLMQIMKNITAKID